MKPERGEVWQVDFGMIVKVRPAAVLSVELDDLDRVVIAVVPHTTQVRGSRFEVRVELPFLEPGVFGVQGLAAVHPRQFIRRRGTLTPDQLAAVEDGVRRWLGL